MPSLESRLLVVTDRHQTNGRPLLSVLSQALRAGARAIQLRERDLPVRDLLSLARDVHDMAVGCGNQLLINDRIDVALALERAGVHLRSDSLPLPATRLLLGSQRLLGISVHSVKEAVEAEKAGADYVVLGPVYETPSKQAYGPPLGLRTIEEACQLVKIPILAIGGITAARAYDVRRAGAFGVAVITAVLAAGEVESATRTLLGAVESS